MLHYREIQPSPALADRIECFWTIGLDGPAAIHRVVPDGCADILLTLDSGSARLDSVGPMTTWRDHTIHPGRELFGIRFHPGRSPIAPLPDAIVDLEDLWGAGAKRLLDRLANTPSPRDRARLLETTVPADSPNPVTSAIAHLDRLPLDRLAREANLSPRQFRRLCLQKTGYTPKLLARILRFRRAATRLTAGEPAATVAVDCGYYDQPHLINDYRAFAGRTPASFSSVSLCLGIASTDA